MVYQNDNESMVGFWVKRGFLDSGFTMFVYKSDDNSINIEQIIKGCMWDGYEVYSERKAEQWYYLTAKDEND